MNAVQESFGLDRLKESVRDHRRESPQVLVQTINDAVAAFVGEATQFDDFTLVVAARTAG